MNITRSLTFKFLAVMLLIFTLTGALSVTFSGTAHASAILRVSPHGPGPGPGPNPNCQTSQITDLSGNHYYFRTQISCGASSSRITSRATAQYETRQDTAWSSTNAVTTSDCSYCNGLLNPGSGGLAVLDVGGYPQYTCFRVYETFTWIYAGNIYSKNIAGGDKCK